MTDGLRAFTGGLIVVAAITAMFAITRYAASRSQRFMIRRELNTPCV